MTLMLGENVTPPDNRDETIRNLRIKVNELEIDLAAEKARSKQTIAGAAELKRVLTPLYSGLCHIFGEFEDLGVGESTVGNGVDPRKAAVWDSWKQKLGGHTARAIDVLMLHGSMNRTQLRLHLNCATGTVVNVVTALNKAGLINKNGNEVSLKEL